MKYVMRVLGVFVLVVGLGVGLISCGGGGGSSVSSPSPPDSISFEEGSITELAIGSTLNLELVVTPNSASERIEWSVDDEDVATVSAEGMISGIASGTVLVSAVSLLDSDIEVTRSIQVASRSISVSNFPENGLRFEAGPDEQTYQLVVDKFPNHEAVEFLSSNSGDISVDSNGLIRTHVVGFDSTIQVRFVSHNSVVTSSVISVFNVESLEWPFSGGFRYGMGTAVYDDKLWVVGGGYSVGSTNEVWTFDGITWEEIETSDTPGEMWDANTYTHLVLHRGKLSAMLGFEVKGVWSSDDGIVWEEKVGDIGATSRTLGGYASFDCDDDTVEELVIFGGSSLKNDVWMSEDEGATWTQLTSSANWTPRYGFQSIVYDDRLWLFGGKVGGLLNSGDNQVWSTEDCVNWDRETDGPTSMIGRHANVGVVDDTLYLVDTSSSDIYYYDGSSFVELDFGVFKLGQYSSFVSFDGNLYRIGGLGSSRASISRFLHNADDGVE